MVAAVTDSDVVGVRFACGVIDRVAVAVIEIDLVKPACETVNVCMDGVRPTVDDTCTLTRLADVVTEAPSLLGVADTECVAMTVVGERLEERDSVRREADDDAA